MGSGYPNVYHRFTMGFTLMFTPMFTTGVYVRVYPSLFFFFGGGLHHRLPRFYHVVYSGRSDKSVNLMVADEQGWYPYPPPAPRCLPGW